MNKSIYTLALFLLTAISGYGQTKEAMTGGGKFNVVIAVLAVIFTGITVYLILIDRKVSRIEKQRKEQQKTNA